MNRKVSRYGLFLSLLILLVIGIQPVLAQRPTMSIVTLWSPTEQLTSINGVDERTVDLHIYAQGNIQFWAVNMTCIIGRGTELSDPVVTWGPEWGTQGTDFFVFPNTSNPPDANNNWYDATRGTFTATATRLGNTTPMIGVNGVNTNILLATIRFDVNELTANARVLVRCTLSEFLDRDGRLILRGRHVPNFLDIRIGYTLTGTALRQGASVVGNNNIEVSCDPDGTGPKPPITIFTNVRGAFSFGGATTPAAALRDQGVYVCTMSSKLDAATEDTQFLQTQTTFNLTTPEYYLLPFTLPVGDLDANNTVEVSDLALITGSGNWGGIVTPAFSGGDVNGDRRVDRADLAIVAGNEGISEPIIDSHVVYGLGRDFGADFPNSKIWWGGPTAGPVVQHYRPSRTRDFWPQVSPDGRTIVYVIEIVNRFGTQHHLYTSDLARPRPLPVTAIIRSFTSDALAPSWSPDGNRIGFICSWQNDTSGYEYNEGNLCVMNLGDRTGQSIRTLDTDVKVFPPAWHQRDGQDVLIYAGLASNTTCPNTLCYYDFNNNVTGKVHTTLDFGANDIVEQPIVINYFNGTNYLFYRFFDDAAGFHKLRVATFTYTFTPSTIDEDFADGVATGPGSATHNDVADAATTQYVDYYDVSPMLDVMFYTFDHPTESDDMFRNLLFDEALLGQATEITGNWTTQVNHFVDGFVDSPSSISGGFGSGVWNGDLNVPTERHAHRAAFDWIP